MLSKLKEDLKEGEPKSKAKVMERNVTVGKEQLTGKRTDANATYLQMNLGIIFVFLACHFIIPSEAYL